jgi:hypothetical protein
MKRERTRENQDTDLRRSAICLHLQECGHIQINELGLQHNIFRTKPYCTDRYEKPQNTLYSALPTGYFISTLVLLPMLKGI